MSWSYSGDPATSTRDEVRFLVGDTDEDDQQLGNEEIDHALTTESDDAYMAAVRCVEALLAKYSRKVDKSLGDLSISYSKLADHYSALLANLRRRATIQTCTPYAGGISIADRDSTEDDSDRVAPAFKRGMHDYETTTLTGDFTE